MSSINDFVNACTLLSRLKSVTAGFLAGAGVAVSNLNFSCGTGVVFRVMHTVGYVARYTKCGFTFTF